MKQEEIKQVTVTEALKNITGEDLDRALRKAFPQAFVNPDAENRLADDLKFYEELCSLKVPEQRVDVVAMVREIRDENHLY